MQFSNIIHKLTRVTNSRGDKKMQLKIEIGQNKSKGNETFLFNV